MPGIKKILYDGVCLLQKDFAHSVKKPFLNTFFRKNNALRMFSPPPPSSSSGLGWLPCVHALGTMLSVITTYSIAVVDGDVPAFFPSISDTGSRPIERNVFTLLVSLCSALGALIFLIRYFQVVKWINENNKQNRSLEKSSKCRHHISLINNISLVTAIIITFSSFTIAAFQVINALLVRG